MLRYLIITSVRNDEDKEKYFRLAKYLKSLNSQSEVHFVEASDSLGVFVYNPYQVDFNKPASEAIKLCEFAYASVDRVKNVCVNFVHNNGELGNQTFILFNCFLIAPEDKMNFEIFRKKEHSYRLYDFLKWFLCTGTGKQYCELTDFACFSNDCIGLNFMSRALVFYADANSKPWNDYTEKNLWWFKHSDNATTGSFNFSDELINNIKKI